MVEVRIIDKHNEIIQKYWIENIMDSLEVLKLVGIDYLLKSFGYSNNLMLVYVY